MKLFIAILVAVFIATAHSQKGSKPSHKEFQKAVKDAATFVNTFSGDNDQFQAAVSEMCAKAPQGLSQAQKNQFENAVCDRIKETSDYQCDDLKAAMANC
ncbi:unnamed protein product [Chironomus riparius]|uniref:Uncharacterized protein n=1 Tax=Chironomus riparius TaxID=315576 RepID=A0A9N9S6Z1_9DIPT|nr:unnamed protein product [Chironomus riparius]